jgi:hypothetical protein
MADQPATLVDQDLDLPLRSNPFDDLLDEDLPVVGRPNRDENSSTRIRQVRNPAGGGSHEGKWVDIAGAYFIPETQPLRALARHRMNVSM